MTPIRFKPIKGQINISPKNWTFIILSIFCLIYCLISFGNHYNFRTYSLDLGVYTNALYDYAHFQWNDGSVFKTQKENLLSDHFDLYLILFSPLVHVFKTYTLLILQIFFIIFGAIGIEKYFRDKSKKSFTPLLATTFFLGFYGIFSAVSYDYHSNVVAACLVPWLLYYVKKENFVGAGLFCILIIIGKENMSLWLSFILLGLAINYRKSKSQRNFSLIASALSLSSFMLIIGFIMPTFSHNGMYPHFHYSVLGDSGGEAFKQLLLHPIDSLNILFTNHTGSAYGDYVKLESHLFLVICGLPLLVFKPQYLVMLIPIYAQKFFHDNHLLWSVGYQYSVEFTPILAIGIFSSIDSLKHSNLKKTLSIGVLLLSIGCTVRVMDNTQIFTNKNRVRFYKKAHYSRKFDVQLMHDGLTLFPKNAPICATRSLVPHLVMREKIYEYPILNDAEYMILSKHEEQKDLLKDEPWLDVQTWETLEDNNCFILLKKK